MCLAWIVVGKHTKRKKLLRSLPMVLLCCLSNRVARCTPVETVLRTSGWHLRHAAKPTQMLNSSTVAQLHAYRQTILLTLTTRHRHTHHGVHCNIAETLVERGKFSTASLHCGGGACLQEDIVNADNAARVNFRLNVHRERHRRIGQVWKWQQRRRLPAPPRGCGSLDTRGVGSKFKYSQLCRHTHEHEPPASMTSLESQHGSSTCACAV